MTSHHKCSALKRGSLRSSEEDIIMWQQHKGARSKSGDSSTEREAVPSCFFFFFKKISLLPAASRFDEKWMASCRSMCVSGVCPFNDGWIGRIGCRHPHPSDWRAFLARCQTFRSSKFICWAACVKQSGSQTSSQLMDARFSSPVETKQTCP